MKNKKPLLTIGLPVYNGQRFLRQTLNSLLKQTFKDFNLIILDNASTDKTPEICKEYLKKDKRIHYYRNKKTIWSSGNFNKVFNKSLGEYFMWAGDDDYWHKNYLRSCLEKFKLSKKIVLVGSKTKLIGRQKGELIFFDKGISTRGLAPKERLKKYKLFLHEEKNVNSIFCGVYKRKVLVKVMPLKKVVATDHVSLFELCLLGEFITVSKLLMFKRFGWMSKDIETIIRVDEIKNKFFIKYPWLTREILLQKIIFKSNKIRLNEKISLSCWSWVHYARGFLNKNFPRFSRRFYLLIKSK